MVEQDRDRQDGPLEKAVMGIKSVFHAFLDIFTKMDLDEMAGLYSEKLDEQILKTCRETGWTYRGGQFIVTYVTKETFSIEVVLYYQDAQDEWREVKSITSRHMKWLKERAVQEIFEKKKVKYPIDLPVEGEIVEGGV